MTKRIIFNFIGLFFSLIPVWMYVNSEINSVFKTTNAIGLVFLCIGGFLTYRRICSLCNLFRINSEIRSLKTFGFACNRIYGGLYFSSNQIAFKDKNGKWIFLNRIDVTNAEYRFLVHKDKVPFADKYIKSAEIILYIKPEGTYTVDMCSGRKIFESSPVFDEIKRDVFACIDYLRK